jgi:hypothetical protein
MRIVMVAAEIAPFNATAGPGADVAALSASLASRGHEVHAVAPLPSPETAEAHSLARRLRPIRVSARDRDRSFVRYDGRTSAGVEVHLLDGNEADEDRGADYWDAFCAAASEVIDSLGRSDVWCASWNAECASLPVRDRDATATTGSHLFVIRSLDPAARESVERALAASDRALIIGRAAEVACRRSGISALQRMLTRGHACSVATPVADSGPVHRSDKASAKAALQASVVLPVRRDVPLLLAPDPPSALVAEALAQYLRGDVQAVVAPGGESGLVDPLLERYPDRVARLPRNEPSASDLLAADGCAVVGAGTPAARAMARGAVPVTTSGGAEGVIDLEPSLSSGSGFVASSDTARSLAEALSRLAAAFQLGRPFADLAERLPGYTTSWSDASRVCEQLIGAGVEKS